MHDASFIYFFFLQRKRERKIASYSIKWMFSYLTSGTHTTVQIVDTQNVIFVFLFFFSFCLNALFWASRLFFFFPPNGFKQLFSCPLVTYVMENPFNRIINKKNCWLFAIFLKGREKKELFYVLSTRGGSHTSFACLDESKAPFISHPDES